MDFKVGRCFNMVLEYKIFGRLVEGIDYYMENGMFVMMSWFYFKWGYCCGSGCWYCLYLKG